MSVGKRIAGRFAVECEVGAGGMGTVYRAHDRALGKTVAVKVLRTTGTSDRKRFGREVAVLAELSHPGIVGYVSHGELADGRPYLVTEWIDGGSLAERLDGEGLSPAAAVVVAHRIAAALEPVHARGLVHRDIKPTNIMLANGSIRDAVLIDFGVARSYGGDATRMTATGITVGTPGYMSPEQARGLLDIDPRTDVFALGCVLYECLTGMPAFAGANALAVQLKILIGEPPPIADVCPELPAPVCLLVERMLAKDPEIRPYDGGVLARALAGLPNVSDQRRARALARAEVPTTVIRPTQGVSGPGRRGVLLATRVGDERATIPNEIVELLEAAGARVERLARGAVLATIPADDERIWALAREVRDRWQGASVAVSFADRDDELDRAVERVSMKLASVRMAGVFGDGDED